MLAKEGIAVRVIDAYSIKPLDEEGIRRGVGEAGRLAVVVEDHFEAGGLGEAVAQALSGEGRVKHLCVRKFPGPAKPAN